LEGFIYVFGANRWSKIVFNTVFCLFIVIECTTQLSAILDFSDSIVFAMALANVLALYLLGPAVKSELIAYWARVSGR
jgi:AGCS family alanine or glycine:cation symporter